jgi:hypothetical protein
VDDARRIRYPQVGHDDAAVDIETVPERDDVLAMMEDEGVRDKALLAVAWETGSRVTALASLKVKHWSERGASYGLIRHPGSHVTGLKGAAHDAKPLTFARGYLDRWLAEHPLGDDEEAPLFCPTRSQDDPSEHLSPHSITLQIKRIARRTEGVDADNVSSYFLKHGRATEMRKWERYSKGDIEQVMDWEDGTPMHARYEHVSEPKEAERILRKHGYEPEDDDEAIEQHECPRCGTLVDSGEHFCPKCSLRQTDGRPRWWQVYRDLTPENDPVRIRYANDLPPPSVSALTPAVFDHVAQRLLRAMLVTADEEIAREVGCDTERKLDEADAEWVFENVPDAAREHRREFLIANLFRQMDSGEFKADS